MTLVKRVQAEWHGRNGCMYPGANQMDALGTGGMNLMMGMGGFRLDENR